VRRFIAAFFGLVARKAIDCINIVTYYILSTNRWSGDEAADGERKKESGDESPHSKESTVMRDPELERRQRLLARLWMLPTERLAEVEAGFERLEGGGEAARCERV